MMNDSIIATQVVREAEQLTECIQRAKVKWQYNKDAARTYALHAYIHFKKIGDLLEKADGEMPSINNLASQLSPGAVRRNILGQWSDDDSPIREDELSSLT